MKKTAYFVAGAGGEVEIRFADLRQAFAHAKEVAKENKFHTAYMRKIVWDADRRIISHEGCKVDASGKWEYLYR